MTMFFARKVTVASALALLALTMNVPARAAGSDSGDAPQPTETTQKCKDGQVWDEESKKCVKPQKSGFNDDRLYDNAREFAYAGQYDNAIAVLKLAKNQNDPRILNYLGYSNRKAGRVELGMTYYRKALSIDPNFILARSYMGQALLLEGDVQGARTQLVEIRDRGGEDTYAYRALFDSLKRSRTY